ncbi:hypothetical protein L6452_39352 [Arctium lappa]|uniref:Uncharacterized protein n=1 Tax=Arctium lappa TaxID=4217 RepID=A0ACB8XSZ1_ARCLA|nr:hypothetical protein L6452_39352 [Arctium lappa]
MTSSEASSICMDEKPPVLFRGEYEQWKDQFLDFIERHEMKDLIRKSLREGIMTIPTKPYTHVKENGEKVPAQLQLRLDAYSDEQKKRHATDQLARSFLLNGMTEEISKEIFLTLDRERATGKLIWEQIEKCMTGSVMSSKVKVLEAENNALKRKISHLEAQIQKQESVESNEKKSKDLESANAELEKKLSEFKKKIADLSKKSIEEKKILELQILMLSQKVEDFEKVIILERDQFAKERKANDQKGAKMGFEEERSILEASIKKLTEKLSELSKSVLTEKKKKSAFEKKIDLLIKERDSYSSKVKELQNIISKTVVVTERTTPESKIHSPRNNSVGSNKPAASSHQKTALFKRSVKSSNQIHSTNLFYDRNIDCSSTHQRRRRSFQEEAELVWNRKPVKEELKCKNSCVHTPIAKKNNALKGKPDFVYSRDKLISLSGNKFYCSYCRTHDPVHKTSDHYWYGSYSITPIQTATNTYGPKYQWVPKKTKPVLQAPTVKGE